MLTDTYSIISEVITMCQALGIKCLAKTDMAIDFMEFIV